MEVVGVAEIEPRRWKLTFNGQWRGDSPTYFSHLDAECQAVVWVGRYGRDYYRLDASLAAYEPD